MIKIAGLDLSMNSSGLIKFVLGDELEILSIERMGFTEVKKDETDGIHHFRKRDFDSRYGITAWMGELILRFVGDCDYVALEGYAYGASGNNFDIGEFVGYIKTMIYLAHIPMRIYDPNSIKKFATGRGVADKLTMYEFFEKLETKKPDLTDLPTPTTGKGKSPTSDIVDAFFITKLLHTELTLRKGFVILKELSDEKISIFNRVTKNQPQNLLDTDFIVNSDS